MLHVEGTPWSWAQERLRRWLPLDLTRTILALSGPVILSFLLQNLVGIVDVWMVGRLGTVAQAAVGASRTLVMVLFIVSLGVATGTRVLVSQAWGAGDRDRQAAVVEQSLGMIWALSLPLAAVGILFATPLLRITGARPEVLAEAVPYFQLLMAGVGVILSAFIVNASFQGAGDTRTPLGIMAFINLIHIPANYAFILGPGPFPSLGVQGAAVGTLLSRSAGFLLGAWLLHRRGLLRSPRHLWPNPSLMGQVLKVGIPDAVQGSLRTWGALLFLRIVALTPESTAAVAALTIGLQVEGFAIMPALGLLVAGMILVGQSLGAGDREEARRRGWGTAVLGVLLLAPLGLLLALAAEPLARLFSRDPAVIPLATLYLRVMGLTEGFTALAITLRGAFNGAGKTQVPMGVTAVGQWGIRLPLAALLALWTPLGAAGAWIAMAVSNAVQAGLMVELFRRRWDRMVRPLLD